MCECNDGEVDPWGAAGNHHQHGHNSPGPRPTHADTSLTYLMDAMMMRARLGIWIKRNLKLQRRAVQLSLEKRAPGGAPCAPPVC